MNFQKVTKFNLLLGMLVVMSYIMLAVFAPLSMIGMNHHGADMSDCPFMIGETAICEMNALDHIANWQAMTVALPAEIIALFLLLATAFFIAGIFRHLFDPPDIVPSFYLRVEPRYSSFRSLLLGSAISPRAP